MSDDDEIGPGWTIDSDTRTAMRLSAIRTAAEAGDHTTAIIEAEELLEELPDHAEGLFLLAECMLEAGDAEGAVPVYEHCLAIGPADAKLMTGLAIGRFDLGDLPGSAEAAREAVRIEPDRAEAYYYLGLALERLPSRRSESIPAFVAANRLDAAAYPFPVDLTDAQWNEALSTALLTVPHPIAEFWQEVPFELLDSPDLDELRRSRPPITPTVSGLYEGEPPEDADPAAHRPTRMRLFKENLARTGSYEEVVDQIARTLESEAASWLDLDEEPET